MKRVLVHVWGFHSGVWDNLIPPLGGHALFLIDLGFIRGGPKAAHEMPGRSLCIGHSFGVMWLLKHGPRPMRGLVSIAGFDCLHKYVPENVLEAMRDGLRRDPQAQLQQFWNNAGLAGYVPEGELDGGGLRGGLDWIAAGDAGEELKNLGTPVLALAGKDDRVVREDASQAIRGGGAAELHWRDQGGPLPPRPAPDRCRAHISSLAV